ncbi:MAG: UbiH/UbiF/VisC/COQ6 family ubiquinone biosynthesis hydroxylase [Kangiellaceae bacterium]|nr:UbiH/UbiF/VisC/COQ6 family ubiquinone biosynthesis hydroxylase [Kangiellaceae bacterium]
MALNFDIAIIGGGMVGLAMAAALAETGKKILIVEKQDFAQSVTDELLVDKVVDGSDFDIRVSAISPANRQLLTEVSAWQNIPLSRQADYQMMNVWDGDGSGKIEFSAAQLARQDLGVIVENKVIQAALIKVIESYGNIECRFGSEIESIETTESSVNIRLEDGRSMSSQLLIGADGAHSTVRKKLNIRYSETDYQQIAFVANVKTAQSHEHTAWQRFTPTGPIAFLPLPQNNLCSVVWSLDKDKAEKIQQLNSEEFAIQLQHNFESRLGKVELVSKFLGFPLVKRHTERYLVNRVALIGDAAHTIHPLAGQGVNLGFQDVSCLSALIKRLIEKNRDFGLIENLRPFERERKTENLVMQNAMSAFKHIFANQTMPITLVRNFAMSALNKVPIAKEIIIKKAMGL